LERKQINRGISISTIREKVREYVSLMNSESQSTPKIGKFTMTRIPPKH